MNKVSNAPSIQDACSICASHASVDSPYAGKSDCVTEQVNTAQAFPSSNNPYFNTYNHGLRNHPNFSWRSQNVKNPKCSLADLPLLVFKTTDMLIPLPIKLHEGALILTR